MQQLPGEPLSVASKGFKLAVGRYLRTLQKRVGQVARFLLERYLPLDGSADFAELMSRNQVWPESLGA